MSTVQGEPQRSRMGANARLANRESCGLVECMSCSGGRGSLVLCPFCEERLSGHDEHGPVPLKRAPGAVL